ncbi:MAG: hypothetical protein V4697_03605 [Patescibacteria group bacterium]
MAKILISGIVLRSIDKIKTAEFYSRLGLVIHDHQHGGPMHYEVKDVSKDFVVEIYQNSEKFCRDALMIEVEHMQDALDALKEFCGNETLHQKEAATMRFVYIKDPDGRDVMLIEQK